MKTLLVSRSMLLAVGAGLLLILAALIPSSASAATSCGLYRDLRFGDVGADVRCLQQYLNDEYLRGLGYTLGDETGVYDSVTQEAVRRWQVSNGIYPATGNFGALSRTRFQLAVAVGGVGGGGVVRGVEAQARASILDAIEMIDDAETDANTTQERNRLNDARDDLFEAIRAYFDGDYTEARDRAEDAEDRADDLSDSDHDNTDREEAQDRIDEVQENINDARDEIRDADNDGDDIDEANDILKDARDILSDARKALRDRDEDEAMDLADEADDRVDDALDAIDENGNKTQSEVEDDLDDARDELDDAREEVDDAIDDDINVHDAEDLLDDADERLDDAEDELDRGDEDEADDLIDEARDLIDEALDEF